MKIINVIMIVLCSIMVVSCQSDTAKADKLMLNNEFDEAAGLYQKAADAGDAYAMWRLSNAYANGDGVEFDEEKALNLLTQAANAGCLEAECDLAMAYMFDWYGVGEDKDKGKVMMDALVERTDNSHVMAQYARLFFYGYDPYEEDKDRALEILDNIQDKNDYVYLRLMAFVYRNGTSKIKPNIDKAIDYFKKSFKHGNRYSAVNLYDDYIEGFGGLTADTTTAIEWLQKGIEANQTDCMIAMSDICLSDDSAFKKYHNTIRGIELLKSAAKHGSSQAYHYLGIEYYTGEHVEKDDVKSFEYTKKAADMRDYSGMHGLGWRYLKGTGCNKNIEKGLEMWKEAVELGSGAAANDLYCYYSGGVDGVIPIGHKDNELAKVYLLKAVELGDCYGYWNIARNYYSGNGLFERNYSLAYTYMKKAADAGILDACASLAFFYREGIGCEKNPNKAREYENKTKAKEDLEKEHLK